MNFNFQQIALAQKLHGHLNTFRQNHPKFPMFLDAISKDALREGTVVEFHVTTPEGQEYTSNLRLQESDLEFIETLKSMRSGT